MLGKRSLARAEPGSVSRGKSKLESKKRLVDTDDRFFDQARPVPRFRSNGETYAAITENLLRDPMREPLSTFSVDVDTASYAKRKAVLE